jgi:hypothetical protein
MSCDALSLAELRILASATSIEDSYAISRKALCQKLNLSEKRDYGQALRELYKADQNLYDFCIDPTVSTSSEPVEPKDHQRLVKHTMLRPDVHGLIVVHGLGSGKTITAIISADAWIKRNPKGKVLVVVNASMREQFGLEIKRLSKYWKRYTVMSREQYINKPSSCEGTFLIVDEAHNLRSPDSKTTMSIMKCSKTAAKIMLLTATPIVNGIYEMSIPLNILNPKLKIAMRKDKFEESYGRNGLKDKKKIMGQMKGLVSYFVSDTSGKGSGFPRKETHEIFVPMTPEQGEAYDALIRKEVSNHSIDAWGSEDQMERAMKFFQKPRQMCNMVVTGGVTHRPKIDALVSNVVDSVSRGKKCLVYSQYLDAGINEIESMLRMTKIHFVKIVGDINAVKKNEAKCAFNSGKARILLISRSGSEGIDLKETDEVHLLEPHWNPAVTNQVVGRAVRYKSHEDEHAVVKIFHYYAEKSSPTHKNKKKDKDGSKKHKSQISIKPNLKTESFDSILWHINWIKSVTMDAFVKQVIIPSSIEFNSLKYSLPADPEPPIKPNKHSGKDTKLSKKRFNIVTKFEIPFFLK